MNNKIEYLTLLFPILLIIALILTVYIPQIGFNPSYNFIYAQNDYSNTIYVDDVGKLENIDTYLPIESRDPNNYYTYNIKLFEYDIITNTSREFKSSSELVGYKLMKNPTSPDGYFMEIPEYRSFGFLGGIFMSGNYNEVYLTNSKTGASKRLNIENYYNVRFLGWVEK